MNKVYLGTNTKMYKNIQETVSFLTELQRLTEDLDHSKFELFVIPSFTTLESAFKCIQNRSILLGAQNMGWEEEGQFSGEISPLMLKETGVEIVMIGHSERRHVLLETDGMENRKVLCALRNGLMPLLCIGETLEQKESGISDEVLRIQLKRGLSGVSAESCPRLRIAYEPVWAIGVNGKPASKEYAGEKHLVIRQTLNELFGRESAAKIPVLYGGSVNNDNAVDLISMPEIDGLFIGRSAWNAENFSKIIRSVLS